MSSSEQLSQRSPPPTPELSAGELPRYARQTTLPELGVLGQERLRAARVAVVGAGGLGCPVLSYLAVAGVGSLTVIDSDVVELSNLHRQPLYGMVDIGESKALRAAVTLRAHNPDVRVTPQPVRLSEMNAPDLLRDHHLIIDGSDTFATHYLVDDVTAELGIACVWGSVAGFSGQTSVSWPPYGPRYRDLYPQEPLGAPSCAETGVLGPVCGAIGSLMATEAIKLLTGLGTPLLGTLVVYDGLDASLRRLRFRSPSSADASNQELPMLVAPAVDEQVGSALCRAVGPRQLANLLETEPPVLIDVREASEHQAGAIPGSIHLPLAQLEAAVAQGRLSQFVPHDSKGVVVYCASGVRSQRAASLLRAAKQPDVIQLAGGYHAWLALTNPALQDADQH